MGERERTVLEHIAFVVLGNGVLILLLVFLGAWHRGWRRTLWQVWEWTLVVSVYFGVLIAAAWFLLVPTSGWLILHTHYDSRQICEEGIRVERVIRSWDMWARRDASGVLDHPSRVFLVDPKGRRREIYNLQFLKPKVVVADVESVLAEGP